MYVYKKEREIFIIIYYKVVIIKGEKVQKNLLDFQYDLLDILMVEVE